MKCLLLGLSGIVFMIGAVQKISAASAYSDVVVFGDSLSVTGNDFLASGGVVTSSPYFEGRYSNGPVWVEVLASQLGLNPPTPSWAGGTNYAWGGANTGGGYSSFGTPNIGTQIDSFLADHGGLEGNELIVIENAPPIAPPYPPAQVVKDFVEHISELAAAGGNTFLVPNTFEVTDFPVQHAVPAFNAILPRELDRLEQELGITIFGFDIDGVNRSILESPESFGLTNITGSACPGCGLGVPAPDAGGTVVPNPDEYYRWDIVHPTRVVHKILGNAAAALVAGSANALVSAPAVVPEPAALGLACVGIAALVQLRRRRFDRA